MIDYMGELERERYCMLLVLLKVSQELLETNLLSKEEKTNLKKAIAFGQKVNLFKEGRLNKSAAKTLNNVVRNGKVTYMDLYSSEVWNKKKNHDIKASYDENKEYFNLVELIFHYNCRGCTRCDYQNCDFYKEFEENSIPELVDTQVGKCKYYYEELK